MQTFTFYASDDKLGNRGNKAAEIGVQFVYLYVNIVNLEGTLSSDFVTNSCGESQFKKMCPKLKMFQSFCNQTVNLKALYYSILKLKYSPSILKHSKG